MLLEVGRKLSGRVDLLLLSRYEITKACHNAIHDKVFLEWIEPLTVHGRHPFALLHCMENHWGGQGFANTVKPFIALFRSNLKPEQEVGIADLDYILFLSDLHYKISRWEHHKSALHRPQNFIFNAGTSRFDSSLY